MFSRPDRLARRSPLPRLRRRTGSLALAAAITAAGLNVVGAHAAESPALDGTGTSADPFVIDSVSDLDAATSAINGDFDAFGSLSYRLDADIDYAGAEFPTVAKFSGVFDGNGHTVRDMVYDNDATDSVGFFQLLDGAEVRDVTWSQISATTTSGAGSAGVVAVTARNSTVSGVTVIDSRVELGPGGVVNTQAAGLVASPLSQKLNGEQGRTVLRDNVVWNTTVHGTKYVAGIAGYPRDFKSTKQVELINNLVIDSDVNSRNGGSGATAGGVNAQGALDHFTATGNVIHGGTIRRTGSGTAAGLGAPTSAANFTDDNLVTTSTAVSGSTVAGTDGTPATLRPLQEPGLADLTAQAGFEEIGWDFSADGAWRWSDVLGTPVLKKADLDVAWAVTYELAGGTAAGDNPTTREMESAEVTLANPTRPGYDFAGWTGTDLASATTTVTIPAGARGDRGYTATWRASEYPLSYDLAGGTALEANPATFTVETGAFTLANPSREGYAFAGWTGTDLASASTTVEVPAGAQGARSYAATWRVLDFAVDYDLAGGTAAGSNPLSYSIETGTFNLANPTREGYEFSGWTGTGLAEASTSVRIPLGSLGARSYRATWSPIGYAISHDLADGVVGDGNLARYTTESEPFTLINPTRAGYLFAGWTGTGLTSATLDVTIPTGSLGRRSYTATWTAVSYPVSYDLAGGISYATNPRSYTIATPTFRITNPTRRGYTFTGWLGTGLARNSSLVQVVTGSMGARSYVATWSAVAKPARTTLGLSKSGSKKVKVVLRRSGAASPRGKITLTATRTTGRKVIRTRTFTARAGTRTVSLPQKMSAGTWKVRATYKPSSKHLSSSSRTLRVTVKK